MGGNGGVLLGLHWVLKERYQITKDKGCFSDTERRYVLQGKLQCGCNSVAVCWRWCGKGDVCVCVCMCICCSVTSVML